MRRRFRLIIQSPACPRGQVHGERLRVYAAGVPTKNARRQTARTGDGGYVSEGFRAVKMKIGGESMEVDVERVRAVCDSIGPKIHLMIAANNRWTTPDAIRFGRLVFTYDALNRLLTQTPDASLNDG